MTVNPCDIVPVIIYVERNSTTYLITMADMLDIKGKVQLLLACGRLMAALDKSLAILTRDRIYCMRQEFREPEKTPSAKQRLLQPKGIKYNS